MGNQTTKIRPATLADADIIIGHRRRMFADMGYGDERARDVMARATRPLVEAALKDGSYQGWLVEDGGRVVAGGGLVILSFQPTPFDTSPRRAWVVNMYTEPAYRRGGLAMQILQNIIAWCRDQGFKQIFLHASDAGRPLYEQAGFKPTSEMRLVLD